MKVKGLLFLLLSSISHGAQTYGPGDHDFTLQSGGQTRVYRVHVPPRIGQAKLPVVLNFHGGGGNIPAAELSSEQSKHADQNDYLVVYPEGSGPHFMGKAIGTWNAGKCCGKALKEKVNDVGFVIQLLAKLGADFPVDTKRIYATGISNGGMMAYTLACELSEQIAAIAPVAAVGDLTHCPLRRPVSTLHFHGTSDACIPYLGGSAGGCFGKFLREMFGVKGVGQSWTSDPIPQFFEQWREKNHVPSASKTVFEKGQTKCVAYGPTKEGTDLELCTLQNGGHTWPGGNYGPVCDSPESRRCRLFREQVGVISQDLKATDMAWEFFKKHSLP